MTSVVDPKEVTKFNQIARNYWDPEGPMKAIHQINPLRVDFTESFHPLQDALVLDVGCGGGLASEAMCKRGSKVTAIDASPDMLKTAKLHALEAGLTIDYQESHAEMLAQTHASTFDVVTCFEMIEHVPEPMNTLAALAALVRPGGWLIISTINRTPKAYLGAVIAAEYILNWVPKGTHDYARFLKPSEIAAGLRPHGLDIESIEGVVYQPIYQQFKRSTKDLDMNYQLAARKRA
jgi:2-polyprenyl-6-hydroxyphenyl methylase/3-demethylubiquinone-9 3-methyltransferase